MAETETETKTEAAVKPAKKKAGRPKGSKKKAAKIPKRYDAKVKAKILEAAKGKSIAEAHIAAVGAGYKGTAASLYQMLRNAGQTGKKKGKRGRPKGSKNKAIDSGLISIPKKRGRPAKSAANGSGLSEIDTIVRREVDTRLRAARDAAISAFTQALG